MFMSPRWLTLPWASGAQFKIRSPCSDTYILPKLPFLSRDFDGSSQKKTMPNHVTFLLLLLLSGSLSLLISSNPVFVRVADASKRKVHITDDLDDVVDDEEDEAWKQWGKKSTPSPESDLQPSDLSKMPMSEIQAEMMKRQAGPAMGFVKLRLGVRRSRVMKTLVYDWIEAQMWSVFVTIWVGFGFLRLNIVIILVCTFFFYPIWAATVNETNESNWGSLESNDSQLDIVINFGARLRITSQNQNLDLLLGDGWFSDVKN